jgi:hypothetical protein
MRRGRHRAGRQAASRQADRGPAQDGTVAAALSARTGPSLARALREHRPTLAESGVRAREGMLVSVAQKREPSFAWAFAEMGPLVAGGGSRHMFRLATRRTMERLRILPTEPARLGATRERLRSGIRHLRTGVRALFASFDRRALCVLAPAIVAVALLPFVVPMVPLEIKEPLFGDTLIYQYVSWSIRHGLTLYRDIGMMDGPFIHFLTAGMQGLVGITDRGFRKCDLTLHASGSAIIGALLAPTAGMGRPTRAMSRLSWAALASIVWMCWYFTLTWETTTEREVYYALFGSIGMVLLYVSRDFSRGGAMIAIGVGAFLVTSQVFGKPTGVMYPAVGSLCVLLQDSRANMTLRVRCGMFAVGAAACVLAAVLALALFGSLRGYLFWCFTIPYRENRFMWRQPWLRPFLVAFDPIRRAAVLSLVSGVAAIACGLLPARALGFALLPFIAFIGFCLQGRGYNYQAVPADVAGMVLALVMLSAVWPNHGTGSYYGWRGILAMAALTGLAYNAFQNVEGSPYRWSGDMTHWTAPCGHTFADPEKEVGLYIKSHSEPADTVFACCGNSHVILLSAERRTASPFFHAVWLDSVAQLPKSEIQPNPAELDALKDLQATIRDQTCTLLDRRRPGWMVFDNLPEISGICPNVGEMVLSQYRETTVIQGFHVYKRKPH